MAHFRFIPHGVNEVKRSFLTTSLTVDPILSKQLRMVAQPVLDEARKSALDWGGGGEAQDVTARGYRISRRKKIEVRVEQAGRKSEDVARRRPNYGGVQMRHFLEPALEAHSNEVVSGIEEVIGGLVIKKAF